MDVRGLDEAVERLVGDSLAQSTRKAYAVGWRCFMKFCSEVGREPLPASEELLCWFVACLHERGVKSGTCRSYVAAVRAHHLEKGVTLCDGQSRRLQAVLKGVQRREAGVAKRVRRPVTPAVLKKLQPVWCVGVSAADGTMLWAACC